MVMKDDVEGGGGTKEGMVEYDTAGRMLRVWQSPVSRTTDRDGEFATEYNGGNQ